MLGQRADPHVRAPCSLAGAAARATDTFSLTRLVPAAPGLARAKLKALARTTNMACRPLERGA